MMADDRQIAELRVSDNQLGGEEIAGGPPTLSMASEVWRNGITVAVLMLGEGGSTTAAEVRQSDDTALLVPDATDGAAPRPCFLFDADQLVGAVLGWLHPALARLRYAPSVDLENSEIDEVAEPPVWWFRVGLRGQPMIGVESYVTGLVQTVQRDVQSPEERTLVGSSQFVDALLAALTAAAAPEELRTP